MAFRPGSVLHSRPPSLSSRFLTFIIHQHQCLLIRSPDQFQWLHPPNLDHSLCLGFKCYLLLKTVACPRFHILKMPLLIMASSRLPFPQSPQCLRSSSLLLFFALPIPHLGTLLSQLSCANWIHSATLLQLIPGPLILPHCLLGSNVMSHHG